MLPYRMTCPGLGAEVGASLGVNRSFYQGFFLAPTVVCGALKGAVFAANIYEKLGYPVVPDGKESRHDIIQASFLNADEDIAEKLMIPMGTKVVYIERLVWQDNEPIAIDKIYIEDARFPDFITTLSKDRSFYQVMDECYHIRPNHSVLEIDGKAAQSHSADTLKCNVGDPLFSIHKISYDQDGKPIHYSLTTVRCDRVTYVVSTNDSTVMDEKIKSN